MNKKLRTNIINKISNNTGNNEDQWQEDLDKELENLNLEKDKNNLLSLEEKYKTNLNKSPFDYERRGLYELILSSEGFNLLYYGDSNKTPYLAKGYFGAVFEGIYNGKPAAAKVILTEYEDQNEVEVWKKILDLKNSMPIEFLKFIPNIYRLNDGQVEKNNKLYSYQIVIMEKLLPVKNFKDLSSLITKSFEMSSADIKLFSDKINNLLKDPEYLYHMALNIYSKIKNILGLDIDIMKLHKAIILNKLNISSDLEQFSLNILNIILKSNLDEKNLSYLSENMFDRLFNAIFDIAENYVKRGNIPYNHIVSEERTPQYLKYLPETNLFNFLNYLKDNNIKFKDIKENNLMVDFDGNLKIIDVGLYDI